MHGQFVWYELTTPDVDAAKKFYPRFTGWGTQRFDDDYTMWTSGGVPLGGIFRLNDEMRAQGVPPNWMPYVESTDVDETARKAASLGGAVVVAPTEIPGTGRFAVVQDPQGATFGVYKSNTASGSWDGTPAVGRMSWHELMTTDYRKAFEFYRALFGWEQTGEMDMGGGETYQMFGKGAPFGGIFNRPGDMAGMHPFWLVYIHVKDVAKAVATATKAGATVVRPQMEIPGGSIAILGDPQGAGFAVHHASAQAAPEVKPAAKPAAKAVVKSAPKKAAGTKKVAKKAAAKKKVAKKPAKKAAKKATRPAKRTKRAKKPKSRTKARAGASKRAPRTKSSSGSRRSARARGRRR
jgi:predicted enzyme related to lactoylglutathione lyase